MPTDPRAALAKIKNFPQLITYLRDELDWPIENGHAFEDLTFDYTPEELGIDAKNAAKIQEIKRLRPLSPNQPWGIFFIKFEPKKLPVVALRRILSQVALKKRASANSAERAAWAVDDLLFISNYGEGVERQISFAHFSRAQEGHDLPTLKVLGWDNLDTALHLDAVAHELRTHLAWPADDVDPNAWRARWSAAFTLRNREVVTTSRELSIRLADLARAIRDRIKTALAIETDEGPLTKLMKGFQEALIHDLDADGFADMYAQTIAYGLLSARIAVPHKKTVDDFAAHMRTNPFLGELMETFLKVGGRRGKAGIDFDELGVSDVVDLLDDANIEAVVRDFGDRNPLEDPVIHFYELFLKEYDPGERMQRGVFYTPRPVVSYIVRSVDELLRTEFGLADGLADTTTWREMVTRHRDLKIPDGISPDQDFVQILDPATGTGTFLVEVIDIVYKAMVANWKARGQGAKKIDELWNEYVPKHLLTRLHGYELLMAPYAIAHLKIGLKLYETGYRFNSDERARIFLTNALEPAHDFSGSLAFAIPALAHEAQAVSKIKRQQRFTVVIGNPPYSGHSSNNGDWMSRLVRDYYFVDGSPLGERTSKWLQDDYVKFVRLAQNVISLTRVGTIGFITNHGYLDNPTFRGMRSALLGAFQGVRILDLHGSIKKKEKAPDGTHDENVFDIQPGVAITLLSRVPQSSQIVEYADIFGAREAKFSWLNSHDLQSTPWRRHRPATPFMLLYPQNITLRKEYGRFWKVTDIFVTNGVGMTTARDHIVIDFEQDSLLTRAKQFRDSKLADAALCESMGIPLKKGWNVGAARQKIRRETNLEKFVVPMAYRPMDERLIFYHDSLVWRTVKAVMHHMLAGENLGLAVGRAGQVVGQGEWNLVYATRRITDFNLFRRGGNNLCPLYIFDDEASLLREAGRSSNISKLFLKTLLTSLDQGSAGSATPPKPEEIFSYVYAVLHSQSYRRRYAEFLNIDFPRLPLPGGAGVFCDLARLGAELTAVHLLESHELTKPISDFIGRKNPQVERVSWSNDTVRVDKAQITGFHGVPESVWKFQIGGYQVCEKWLKDRKGRTLSKDDIAHYQKIVAAVAETIRLMKKIDDVIEQHGGWPGAFQTADVKTTTAEVVPFRPRAIDPTPKERYVTCVPLVPLKVAAGGFGDPQQVDENGFEWVTIEARHKLSPGMFVAQVVGKSMEPAIPDGAYCLFREPVGGTREGKTVLVQLRDATDPETGQRYTVKRYESEKAARGDSWVHKRITLKPLNPDFEPIVLTDTEEGNVQVIAELVEVL